MLEDYNAIQLAMYKESLVILKLGGTPDITTLSLHKYGKFLLNKNFLHRFTFRPLNTDTPVMTLCAKDPFGIIYDNTIYNFDLGAVVFQSDKYLRYHIQLDTPSWVD